MSGEGMRYDAAGIEVLDGREAVRKRPGMWVGSTGERGLHQMVFEAVGRAVNAVLATGGGCVDVTLTPDGGVRVADDGAAVPFEDAGDGSALGFEALLTSLRAGPDFDGRHIALVGHCSVGLLVVNALSSRLTAEVRCGGVSRVQEHARGVALAPPATAGPAGTSGTTVAFWPDAEIFETTWCSFAVLAERFRQVAFLNRGLEISLTDERRAVGVRRVRFRFPEGVRDFVAALDAEMGAALEPDVIAFEREDPRMAGTMEVALMWGGSREERLRSFANSRLTREGGTHVDGFHDGVAAAVTAWASRRGLLTAQYSGPDADRIGEGLTAVVSVKLDRPEFLGPIRGLLGGAEVRACVREAVREHLGAWFEERPDRAEAIVDRIIRHRYRE
ncbi:DNA gyrase subunit B [Streptomyces sp. NPDC006172]|uniref:DNA gyrase subunit B n=1 Tax=Streptomyces sp. NPDC006172 TaxID=3154470 RepID=UPI003403DD66